MNKTKVETFPNREFSFFCEFKVAFELQKRGWEVYQPLIDRYIDLIAVKDNNYRTIQVKSSRIENLDTMVIKGYESYGLTMQPKDLFHDVRHFYIWVFIDRNTKLHYFIFNVKDFIDIRYYKLPPSSRRKHPSLLMRGEWRWGTDRLHPRRYIKEKNLNRWEVERVVINEYKGNWNKLEKISKEKSHNIICFEATELSKFWKNINDKVLKKWQLGNKKAEKTIEKYPDANKYSKKLLKEKIDRTKGNIDAHLLRISEEEINRIFNKTGEKWEVFFPLKSTDHILLLRPICSRCKKYWDTGHKECFYCKTKYFHIKICENCNKPYPGNVKQNQKCNCGGKIIKKCINCGESEIDRHRVFVPLTFCWHCGNRQNEFEFKHIPI